MAINSLDLPGISAPCLNTSRAPVAKAKPFVKWVGGKGQLIPQLSKYLPADLNTFSTYVEPFVGGGALLFHLAHIVDFQRIVIADSNADLVVAYLAIRERPGQLITRLHDVQQRYLKLNEQQREVYYYKIRDQFNAAGMKIDLATFSEQWIERAVQLIFLNKTCFNGLFRVNSSGKFNASFGKYDNPKICDADNIVQVSHALRRAEIYCCDFYDIISVVDDKSFVYLDPPYRPLTQTANFTSYSPATFTLDDQHRLAQFCSELSQRGAKVLLSNSDPANVDSSDSFFKQAYPGFRIVTAQANRMINCKAEGRGKISELLLMNYGDA